MPEGLRISLLGAVEVARNGKQVRGFESRKALALLGYLASQTQPVSRTQLADLFWGDRSESQSRANLSRVLHNLSTLLPGCFQSDHHTIEFQLPPGSWLDLLAFEENVHQATLDSLHAAVALCRDEFMAGIFLDDCPDLEIWLVSRREHWRQRLGEALDRLVRRHIERGEYDSALPVAERLIALEPWCEEAHAHKMLLLARSGQRSAALLYFETARKMLTNELGAEPGAELKTLYEQIKSGRLAVSAEAERVVPTPSRLPVQMTLFVGREQEQKDVVERLRDPGCRLLTLVGAPGVGKTRLALEAGAQLGDRFPDGVYFVPLAPINDPEFISAAIVESIGFGLSGLEDRRAQILNYLRGKNLLLLLDNFEHLMEGIDLVSDILSRAPEVKLLVTSQERLNLRAEWLILLEGLAFPRLNSLDDLANYDAVRLFVDRARHVAPHFALTAENRRAIIRICQMVEGLPLGLELAAAWAGKYPCAFIAQEIEKNLEFLATSLHDVPARHRNLRAELDWSYALLHEAERVLLRRLAVFAGGATPAAAMRICDLGDFISSARLTGLDRMLQLLNQLADRSLLRVVPQGEGELRFALLEPVRQFAQQCLADSGEQDAIRKRHADYWMQWIEEIEPKMRSGERPAYQSRVEVEYDNLRAALEWSVGTQGQGETALRLVAGLVWYWYFKSDFDEGRKWIEQAVTLDVPTATAARSKLLFSAGMAAWLRGEYDGARFLLETSLGLAQACGDVSMRAFVLTFLGIVSLNQGKIVEARDHADESCSLFRQIGDHWGLALALTNLEFIANNEGELGGSHEAMLEVTRLFGEIKDPWIESLTLSNQMLSSYHQGDYQTARRQLERVLEIRREVGDKWLIAQSLNYLGNVALAASDYAEAGCRYRESILLHREQSDKHGVGEVLEGFARLAVATGHFERAAQLFGAAQALRREIGSPVPSADLADYERAIEVCKTQLEPEVWQKEWDAGTRLDIEQAIAAALEASG